MARVKIVSPIPKFKKFFKQDLRILFPFFYIFVVIFGFVLTFLYTIFPSLVYCGALMGTGFCTPLGTFISLTVSFPGYLIAGAILRVSPDMNTTISLFLVFATSLSVYFLIGYTIDRLRKKPLSIVRVSKYVVIGIFAVLLALLLLLR
jgi:uncharacterized membrane protein